MADRKKDLMELQGKFQEEQQKATLASSASISAAEERADKERDRMSELQEENRRRRKEEEKDLLHDQKRQNDAFQNSIDANWAKMNEDEDEDEKEFSDMKADYFSQKKDRQQDLYTAFNDYQFNLF